MIKDRTFGAYSPEYQKRRTAALVRGFVLVRNPAMRRGLVHIVKAETFGELARCLLRGRVVKTLCEPGTVTATNMPNERGKQASASGSDERRRVGVIPARR